MCLALIQRVILIYKNKKHVNDVFLVFSVFIIFTSAVIVVVVGGGGGSQRERISKKRRAQRGTALVSKSIDFSFLVKMDSSGSSAVASDLV